MHNLGFPGKQQTDSLPTMDPKELERAFQENPLYKEMLEDLLKIQPGFTPEPTFSKNGAGDLKSLGIEEIRELKVLKERERGQKK
jgi:hypothetical protein